MNSILTGWNIMRALRLVIGIVIVVQGIQANEWMLVVMGGLFSLMPLFNVGCCATGNCAVPNRPARRKESEEIEYEEVT